MTEDKVAEKESAQMTNDLQGPTKHNIAAEEEDFRLSTDEQELHEWQCTLQDFERFTGDARNFSDRISMPPQFSLEANHCQLPILAP